MKEIIKVARLITLCCILAATITFAEERAANKEPNKPNLDPNHEVIKSSLAKLIRSALGEPNEPSYAKLIPAEKLKEDLDFLFKTIEEVHPNMYAYTPKEEFDPLRKQLYETINRPMNQLEFYKTVAPVVASLRSGHTFVFPLIEEFNEYTKDGGKVFPLSLSWDGQKPILTKNLTPNRLPIGGTILAINREDAVTLVQRLARYFPAEHKDSFPWQLERDKLLRLCIWLEFGSVESLDVRVRAIDGTVKNYSVKLMTLDEIRAREDPNEGKNSYRYLPQYDTFLIKLDDWSSEPDIKRFCEKTFEELKNRKASNLIIDICNNPGGNSSCAEVFIEYLTDKPYCLFEEVGAKLSKQFCSRSGTNVTPEMIGQNFSQKVPLKKPQSNSLRFQGHVYLLIGTRSTSTSTAFAASVKHFGLATIVGQETAEPLTTYGSAFDFQLPNSGLRAFSACQNYVFSGSKNDGRSIIPDYEVKQKPEDTAKGVDTVLQFTLDLIKKSGSETSSEQKADNPVQTERAEK